VRVSRIICQADLADPMSGFFMLRREVLERALRRLCGHGFKILLDILVLRFSHLIQLICLRMAGPAACSRSKVKHLTDSEH
jgi:hypothetical protein